ncbi:MULTISPECIES: nucleotide exchange factor GrpE [Stappia]|uniref:nucleotide exchange factor GrpE n=1 Tax=Stappia TaxID=152161 RepID=UPI00082B1FD4|nr:MULTISPECIES: nucleotide exchange factor GrpE [Stappia]MBC2857687.1 nucleotide exchange factor GrpE [Stappia sp. 28M-7]MCC4246738.1 nucleotide exchange factor GrpE [Stappia indica]
MNDSNDKTNMNPEDAVSGHEAENGGEAQAALDPTEALLAENAELKDRMLRTMAEMENLRRRTEKEIRDSKQYAAASFARDMLGVGDNLRRALEAISAEVRDAANDSMRGLIEGVEMTEREMLNQLEKHGVRRIDPAGEKFDPNFHQAMFEVPNTEVPNNTVVQVMQAGYVIGDRVLRPALVGVSKGGPKERKPEGEAPAGEPGSTVDRTA